MYVIQLLDASTQWLGSLIGYTDHANQSISGKAFEDHITGKRSWPYKAINTLFFWQDDHCKKAWRSDETRASQETGRKMRLRLEYDLNGND